jgi:hypothetical protein
MEGMDFQGRELVEGVIAIRSGSVLSIHYRCLTFDGLSSHVQ